MNMSMQDMAKAFTIAPAAPAAQAAPPAAAKGFAGLEVPPLKSVSAARNRRKPAAAPAPRQAEASPSASGAPAAGMVDPAQWWGALTQQFQSIADAALRDAKARSAELPGGMKAAAEQALKSTQAWTGAAQAAAKSTGRKPASKSNAKPASKQMAGKRSR
jgi:hypothetical protein